MRKFQNKETMEIHELTPEMFVRFFENRHPAMFQELEVKSIRGEQYERLFIRLSGHFLSEHLPDDFFTYDEDDQMTLIEDYHWQPFEYHSAGDVYDLIDSLTYDVQNILEKGEY